MAKAQKTSHASMMSKGVGAVLGPTNRYVGTAFFISDKTMLTCAHVVRDAAGLGAARGTRVRVRLAHFYPMQDLVAEVQCWNEAEDVAVLVLREPALRPPGTSALPLKREDDIDGHGFKSLGYPSQAGASQTSGEIQGWQEMGGFDLLNSNAATPVLPGFSGAPIWDVDEDGVVGMILFNQKAAQQHGRGIAINRATAVCPDARQPEKAPPPKSLRDKLLAIAEELQEAVVREFPAAGKSMAGGSEVIEEPEYSEYDGSAYFSLWSTRHPFNRKHPDDADLFYVVAVEGADSDDQRIALSLSLELSERGMLRELARRGFDQDRMIDSMAQYLDLELQSGFSAAEGEWSGLQVHTTELVRPGDIAILGVHVIQRLFEMGEFFERWRQSAPLQPTPRLSKATRARRLAKK